jgi:hypothetical protein
MPSDDICNVWQAQGSSAAPLPLDELRKRAEKFRSRIVRRNLREYLNMAALIPCFGYFSWTTRQPLMRVGNGLLVAGLLYGAYQLHRRASASPSPGALEWENCRAFHREQLARQRDAVSGIWRWQIGPLLPGILAIAAELCLVGFRKSLYAGALSILTIAVISLVPCRVAWLHRDAAAAIQRQIDALD